MARVQNKIAAVTGAANGIGRATALRLAQEGATIAVLDRDARGEDVVREIKAQGGNAQHWLLDVSDGVSVATTFEDIANVFGGLDILVNNAGISGPAGPTHELTSEQWDRVYVVDVKGVFLCTKYAIPLLKKRGGGSIINLSSIYGIVGTGADPAYHASKGAVRMMSKNDALAYAPDGIRVNSVHPGLIWTPLLQDLGARSSLGEEAYRQQLSALHPIGHLGEPDDIAWGIVYLASEEAKFVTGSELVIDGGYTAR